MVNGLALRRAANAAQAQAALMNNTTPVHSEDLQPNGTLNRRRGGATSGSLFNGGSWAGKNGLAGGEERRSWWTCAQRLGWPRSGRSWKQGN